MRQRRRTSLGTALAVALGSLVTGGSLAAQTTSRFTKPVVSANVPRTPDGKPDMQGIWDAATITPLERPDGVKDLVMTEEAMRKLEGREVERVDQLARPSDPNRAAPRVDGNVGGYNYFWIARGNRGLRINGQPRTSLIVDPPDGKIPPQTAEAKRRNSAARGSVFLPTSDAPENAQPTGAGAYDDYELRPLAERCILAFGSSSGPPTLPNYFYNNLKQIVQTKDHIVLLIEMVHDARMVPIGKPHAPQGVRKWMGDSVGRWEGDTFVIETTNFTNKTRFRGSTDMMKVTERLTRLDEHQLLYQFTIEDPATWTTPWSGEYTWLKTDEHVYEYACHEGNYSFQGIMAGERLLDREAAAKQNSEKDK